MIARTEKTLVLSTGHLTWDTILMLEGDTPDQWPVYGGPLPHGFLIYAHDERVSVLIPDDIWACCVYARSVGADYIRFDCDEPVSDSLPDHSGTHSGGQS